MQSVSQKLKMTGPNNIWKLFIWLILCLYTRINLKVLVWTKQRSHSRPSMTSGCLEIPVDFCVTIDERWLDPSPNPSGPQWQRR